MKIALVHYSFKSIGGGERVCLSTIEALNRAGIVPDLFVHKTIDKESLEKVFDKKLDFNLIKLGVGVDLTFLRRYHSMIYKLENLKVKDYDVIIDTSGVNITSLLAPKRGIFYAFNPTVHLLSEERREGTVWRFYQYPYEAILRDSIKKMKKRRVQILSVSNFTSKKIERYWGIKSETVYPPVSIDKFNCSKNTKREGVVSIGRFSFEKNQTMQLEIAKQLPRITFRICGSTMTPYFQKVYESMRSKAETMNLKNVEFFPNISQNRVIELIHNSRYYLHTMIEEDFGLTICEAIAGGCIPVVHDSGGPVEIVNKPELRFNDVGNAVEIFRANEKIFPMEEVQQALFHHIQQFSEDNFQNKMLKIIGI